MTKISPPIHYLHGTMFCGLLISNFRRSLNVKNFGSNDFHQNYKGVDYFLSVFFGGSFPKSLTKVLKGVDVRSSSVPTIRTVVDFPQTCVTKQYCMKFVEKEKILVCWYGLPETTYN